MEARSVEWNMIIKSDLTNFTSVWYCINLAASSKYSNDLRSFLFQQFDNINEGLNDHFVMNH